ncbi:MAG: HEAT repeat domain-containing protein [Phycisphaerales bacterium]|nr:MAG: HEAT repeat domain-containing protein [Phycisphaerales bacterium]
MLDKAFEALKTYHWGQDRKLVKPIDDAVIATRGDAAARKKLEARLAAVLTTNAPYDAKQYVCRKLMIVGTAVSVPTLAGLLTDKKLSHMARFALERIPAPEAGQAIRDALSRVNGELKIGMISSLGVRGEAAGVAPLGALLGHKDCAVATAAAHGLGAMGSPAASEALAAGKPTDEMKATIADASLACAEKLLAAGNKAAALKTYERLLASGPSEMVRVAAKRGKTACTGT